MRPAPFDYVRPASLPDCYQALAEGGTPLAGGQSLLPLLKLRARRPTLLVDLNRVPELHGIRQEPQGDLVINSMTRHQQVADDPLLRSRAPVLTEAARRTGDPQVRARGTIGGNVCFADPRANMATALVALGASATVEHAGGRRRIDVVDLFTEARTTSLQPGELLARFHVPLEPGAASSVYLELAPQTNGVPIVNVAVVPAVDGDGPRIAIGGLLTTTCRATPVEEAVRRDGADRAVIARAIAELTANGVTFSDPRGDADYRARIATVLVDRALRQASTPASRTDRKG